MDVSELLARTAPPAAPEAAGGEPSAYNALSNEELFNAELAEIKNELDAKYEGYQPPPLTPDEVIDPKPTVITNVMPNGITVEYESKPKRLYRVNGVEVPSVTTVLEVLDKPALPWWGMKIGVAGLLKLFEDGHVKAVIDGLQNYQVALKVGPDYADVDRVIDLLKEHKLTVNHVKAEAGDRGQSVHDAFETWSKTGLVPEPEAYPEHERGYVEGLVGFLTDAMPEPLACEVMVGSAEHGFAGRYDTRLEIPSAAEVVVHRTPVRGAQMGTVEAGKYLFDLKTSKDVYPGTHFRQLEAYELAGIEGGYEPTAGRYVVQVSSDGHYKVVRSTATAEDFLAVLRVYESNRRIKEGS